MRILITGATGFIGRSLVPALKVRGHDVRCAIRARSNQPDNVAVGAIGPETDWRAALAGCGAVVHLAGLAHAKLDPRGEAELWRVNVDGARSLAEQAAAAGVRRFVYISSVKVNGNRTDRHAYRAIDPPAPEDPYGSSKAAAETALRAICKDGAMKLVIIRPALVYGPHPKGNFATLLRLVSSGIPLPFGGIANCRSFIAVDNLVDLIAICLVHPHAANETFMASDGEDLSTPQLTARLAIAMGRPCPNFTLAPRILRAAMKTAGRGDLAARLLDSLRVDSTATRERLGWMPPLSVDEGLRRAVGQRLHTAIVKRASDLGLVLVALPLLVLPCLLVALLVAATSPGPILYWSERVGRENRLFAMPKFRTMKIGTPALATHLVRDPAAFLTPVGGLLRKLSLDELPQLWSVLRGDMSLVGPRPALFNQADLIALRTAEGVDRLLPGLTGLAQVNGRDELPIPVKVAFDRQYLLTQSLWVDLAILAKTFWGVFRRAGVSH